VDVGLSIPTASEVELAQLELDDPVVVGFPHAGIEECAAAGDFALIDLCFKPGQRADKGGVQFARGLREGGSGS
jgi:hypothetical protein